MASVDCEIGTGLLEEPLGLWLVEVAGREYYAEAIAED
jgi:hypothetical protein